MTWSNRLREKGYNLTERLCVYTGTALGAVLPVVGMRMVLETGIAGDVTQISEFARWGCATYLTGLLSLGAYGFPLMPSIKLGNSTGHDVALNHQDRRFGYNPGR